MIASLDESGKVRAASFSASVSVESDCIRHCKSAVSQTVPRFLVRDCSGSLPVYFLDLVLAALLVEVGHSCIAQAMHGLLRASGLAMVIEVTVHWCHEQSSLSRQRDCCVQTRSVHRRCATVLL